MYFKNKNYFGLLTYLMISSSTLEASEQNTHSSTELSSKDEISHSDCKDNMDKVTINGNSIDAVCLLEENLSNPNHVLHTKRIILERHRGGPKKSDRVLRYSI